MGALLFYSPFRVQVLGVEKPAYWPRWNLYRQRGKDVCALELLRHTEAGLQPVDRLELLGYGPDKPAPRRSRVVREVDLEGHQKVLCREAKKALGEDVDLRLRAKCARRDTWKVRRRGKRNMCAQAKEDG